MTKPQTHNQVSTPDIHFKKLIENSHEGIALMDKALKVFYRSQSAERINGWNTENRLKKTTESLVHPDDLKTMMAAQKQSLKTPGTPITCTYRARHYLGHFIWLECVYTNFLNDSDINAIVCNFKDVTEKKQADEELQKATKELFDYKYALDESAIVAITDQKGIIQHVNENFCRISKYSKEELIGQDHRIINSGYHDKKFIRNLWATIAKGRIWKGDLKNRAKDGSFYWVDTTIVPFLNEAGKPYQYVAIRSDITERKLSQEKIIENSSFIKTITDNLPALIAYWTTDLKCLFANKPHLEWFDKTLDEMQGISKRELLGDNEFKLHETHIKNVLQGEVQSFERSFHNNKGKTIYTHTQYLPDRDGNLVKGFYSLVVDITDVKLAEQEINKKTKQIEELLENMTDGFLALDDNLCYTYANKKVGEIVGMESESLIGKNIWELFPDAKGSATYKAIQTAFEEKKYVCNEDYYEPLDLWQENRVYPADNGISMFIRDITAKKREERQLRLLQSAITHTTDAVLITEAYPLDEPGPRIVYANEAFAKMTGYSIAEMIGNTPRMLQGPKSDKVELKRLSEAMHKGQTCEITTINYKKNGEEFWINFAISPIVDEKGITTHLIAIERDVTPRKTEEIQKKLLAEIGLLFHAHAGLNDTMYHVLELLANFDNFSMAEAWLIGSDKKKISLVSKYPKTEEMKSFYEDSSEIKSFVKGEGLPGIAWKNKTIEFWQHIDVHDGFLRKAAAKKAGLKTAYGIPLQYNNEIIGVLILGINRDVKQQKNLLTLFKNFSDQFAAEIKRKQIEQELNQLFNFAPDIICIAGADGYFKKINPAMSSILEYSELELLSRPYADFVYPEDRGVTEVAVQDMIDQQRSSFNFENRYITRSGKLKWLAWSGTPVSEEGLIFCVAKDITDKKDLEGLLSKATTLARIGGWEIDMVNGIVHWSAITKEIHEVTPDFEPDLETAASFYKEGNDRELMQQKVKEAFEKGTPYDLELQIVTAKANIKWIRVIGEAEFTGNKCIRIYGSFQDIDARKKAEVAVSEVLEERNTILESIDDAFFAVDKNWVVTYWNNRAENALKMPKNKILGQKLWEVYAGAIDSEMYRKYQEAMTTRNVIQFEHCSEAVNAWLEISIYPAANGLTVYIKNVTDRKQAEATAKEALEERNTILESIDDAFFAVDKNWVVTYWNNTAEEVLQQSREEVLNHNLWDIFSGSVGSESYIKYHEALETNHAAHFEDYYPPLNKWYEISAYPSVNGLSVYFKDVTQRKISDLQLLQLNESLKKQAKELAISNTDLEQFAYVASHDLQEPLRMVTSFLSQIEKKYSHVIDEKGKQYIHFAVDGGKRMRQIILDLLEFSKVKSAEDELEVVDLNKLINEIISLYRKQIEETNATIKVEKLPIFSIYKTPMRQVFQNLISNSLKYHNPTTDTKITIACEENADGWQFSVKDNGIGIEAEYFDKIFIIFQRLHNKDDYSGTGMGLAIAKKIIENWGGRIWVESEPGEGCTFYFTLLKNIIS